MNITSLLQVAFIVSQGREEVNSATSFLRDQSSLSLQSSADAIRAAYLGEVPNSMFLASQSDRNRGVHSCWSETCGSAPTASPCRIEAAFSCALQRYPVDSGVHWFVFTTSAVFWNTDGLVTELERAERMLLPGDPSRDILLIGGGGLLIFEEFMILSRPAVVFLANQVAADNPHGGDHSCKAELLTCSQNGVGTSLTDGGASSSSLQPRPCRFKLDSRRPRGGFPYTANELVHFCLAQHLAQGECGSVQPPPSSSSSSATRVRKPSGCAWVFGRLSHHHGGADKRQQPGGITAAAAVNDDGGGAQAARRRFVSNAAHRRPKGSISELLKAESAKRSPDANSQQREGKEGEGEVSDDPERSSPCHLARALKNFAAFGNANAEDFLFLSAIRDKARSARNCPP